MPRGVPRNGVRRTRSVVAAEETARLSTAVAVSTVHETAGVDDAPPTEEASETPVLTADQQEIKRLRDLLAKESGRKDILPEPEQVPADTTSILIHFLEDGLTVNGAIRYRGDELEFPVGSAALKDTYNRRGESWLDLRNDDFAQVERWGKVMFRNGPWPGKSYADGNWEALKAMSGNGSVQPPTEEELKAAEKARKNRLAPRLPQQV